MERLEPDRPMPNAGAPPNRRRSPRRRTLKGALIVFRSGHCTMGCVILDTSETGALVRPADIMLCPTEFVLKPRVGPSRACEVVWRKGEDLGVRYLCEDVAVNFGQSSSTNSETPVARQNITSFNSRDPSGGLWTPIERALHALKQAP
jgi:hypothetical protein